MTRRKWMAAALAGAWMAASCGGGGKKQLVVAFSQANNAEPVPLRASPHRVGTLVIRFIGLLFLSVTALALVWMR